MSHTLNPSHPSMISPSCPDSPLASVSLPTPHACCFLPKGALSLSPLSGGLLGLVVDWLDRDNREREEEEKEARIELGSRER